MMYNSVDCAGDTKLTPQLILSQRNIPIELAAYAPDQLT